MTRQAGPRIDAQAMVSRVFAICQRAELVLHTLGTACKFLRFWSYHQEVGVANGFLQRLLEFAPRDVGLGGAPNLLACHRRGHDCVALQTNRDRNHWWHGAGRRSKRAARRALAMLPKQKRLRIKTDYRGDGMRWIALLSCARALGRWGRVASGRRRSRKAMGQARSRLRLE